MLRHRILFAALAAIVFAVPSHAESEKGAEHLAEAAAYPDDTAAMVAEFHTQMEQVRAEYLRRH